MTGPSNLDDVFSREHQARFDDAETGGPTPKFEQVTETLLELSEDLRKVMEKYGQEEGKPILIKAQTIVKALIGGLELGPNLSNILRHSAEQVLYREEPTANLMQK